MRLWIDTEFNEFRGELISMALVSENCDEWYEALECQNPGPWVAENVMTKLFRDPISMPEFQASLQAFLMQFKSVHLIADWPEDIQHFCAALITGPGYRLDTPPLTMEIKRNIDGVSMIPHNALADARSIRNADLGIGP